MVVIVIPVGLAIVTLAWLLNVGVDGRTQVRSHSTAGSAYPFTLIDQSGHPFSDTTVRGRVVLLYFGYTFCPDVCPTELGWIAHVIHALGSNGQAVAPVFVTLDPDRDTSKVLNDYVPLFQDHLTGLTGPSAAITALANAYGVVSQRELLDPGKPNGPYSITHSSTIYVLDRDGNQVGTMGSTETVESAAKRLRFLITQGVLLPPNP